MILVTGRTIRQGVASERGKLTPEYKKQVAVVFLARRDMDELSLSPGDRVRVATEHGSVVVRCEEGRHAREGVAFMPYGPWANLVCGTDTQGTGMPDFRGFAILLAKTSEPVMSQEEIARMLGGYT